MNARNWPGYKMWRDNFKKLWAFIREISGDDAYERYLHHQQQCHPDAPVLTRKAFFEEREQQKWNRIKRCC